jgi:uncharacterized NAD(P)/FAD-binding protein YdhS
VSMRKVAVIGFGFSGLMVTATLVRDAQHPCTIYVVAPDLSGMGLAYATTNPEHLLNVVAARMSAYADSPDDFVAWLNSSDAARAKQGLKLTMDYGPDDYVPRALYGAYLASIWRETQTRAAQKKLEIKLVPSVAVAVQREPLAVLTARGDAIAVDAIVLASGNENKPIAAPAARAIMQNPWDEGAMANVAALESPVVLVGTGLTAVDMVLSLRRHGYIGEIIAGSLRGLWPEAHRARRSVYHFKASELFAQKNLRQLVRFVRRAIAQHEAEGGDWRAVIDGLRTHSRGLWLKASTADQRRFLRHVATYWSTHRHRMAPEIAARINSEIAAGTLRSIPRAALPAAMASASRVYNCTGPQLNPQKSSYALWKQLLAEGMVEPHVTGAGVAADTHYRAWGNMHPQLYVAGTMMTGQWLESTAVPELREQAAAIAADLIQAGE